MKLVDRTDSADADEIWDHPTRSLPCAGWASSGSMSFLTDLDGGGLVETVSRMHRLGRMRRGWAWIDSRTPERRQLLGDHPQSGHSVQLGGLPVEALWQRHERHVADMAQGWSERPIGEGTTARFLRTHERGLEHELAVSARAMPLSIMVAVGCSGPIGVAVAIAAMMLIDRPVVIRWILPFLFALIVFLALSPLGLRWNLDIARAVVRMRKPAFLRVPPE